MRGDDSIDCGRDFLDVSEVKGLGDGALEPAFADEGLGAAGQIETHDFCALGVEFGGDGRTQVSGSAGDPYGFVFERVPGGTHEKKRVIVYTFFKRKGSNISDVSQR